MLTWISIVTAACVSTGCPDHSLASAPMPATEARMVGSMQCTANVSSGAADCRRNVEPASRLLDADSDEMHFMLRTANPHYSASDSLFLLDLALENCMGTAIGTRNDTTVVGFRLFLAESSLVTGLIGSEVDSLNAIRILNPDGRQVLLAPDQPYFTYMEKLAPGQLSAFRTWQFHVPSHVQNFQFTVYLFAPTTGELDVPAQAPDSIPTWVYDTGRLVTNPFWMAGTFPRDIVVIRFDPAATREERQTAIDLVGGTVVGGMRFSGEIDGLYYVQVADDPGAAGVEQALSKLDNLPQVRYALPEFVDAGGTGLRMRTDGAMTRPMRTPRTGLRARAGRRATSGAAA